MRAKQLIGPLIALLIVASVAAPAASTGTQAESYAGTNVTFDVNGSAIADYAVQGDTVMQSVAVQSQSEAEANGGIGVGGDLSAIGDLAGADLSFDARAETRATVAAESGAEIRAHDNSRGILVVDAGEESQYVLANVSAAASAESESDDRVTVTTDNGTRGTFIVVGDGNVTVDENGDVAAELEEDSRLAFRAYTDERDDGDERQERMIANGTAAAEVHVMERGGETVTDTVQYGSNTSVEVTEQTESSVTMTAERAEHEGTIVITSVSDAVLDAQDDLEVTVDGEAAARASSYGELGNAVGSDSSKFMVRQASGATAEADVLVAVNHFSEREIEMTSDDSEDPTETDGTDDGSDSDPTESPDSDSTDEPGTTVADDTDNTDSPASDTDGQPGFGALGALVALAVVGSLGELRRR